MTVVYADATDAQLAAALTRLIATKGVPVYVREAAERWLQER